MKSLSIIQPWASFIAYGLKEMETRSWATPYRGDIAIHASKESKTSREEVAYFRECDPDLFDHWDALPYGAVIAVARLVDCIPTGNASLSWRMWSFDLDTAIELRDEEAALGDFSPNRYAWLLADVRRLPEPVPYRGAQGLWEFDDALLRLAVTP
jgi:ASCH domain.